MHLVLDCSSAAKPDSGGIGNYGRGLLRGIVAGLAPDERVSVGVRSHRWLRRGLLRELAPDGRVRLIVDGLEFALLGDADTLHSIGARLPARGRFKRAVTIHDVNVFEFPELSTPSWREQRQARLRETVERADVVVALSHQGARALGEYLGVDEHRTRVIPGGIDLEQFRRPDDEAIARALERYGLDDHRYLLNIGALTPRKNQVGLVEALARARLDDDVVCVFIGPTGIDADALRARAEERGLDADRLLFPGRLPDAELPALYAGCLAYVCSSLHEGQGLPVCEAQACGAAVVTSDRGALPETLGDLGVLFDPLDLDAFTAAIERIHDDDALRAECASRGPERARSTYSWRTIGEQMLALHRELTS